MEDLEKRVSETIERKLTDGTIEKLIEEQLEKSVKSALDDVFGWNGEARKMLKERFESVMCPAIEQHDFNRYVVKLDTVLTEIINQTRFAENNQILSNFSSLLKDTDIKEISLSEIFAEYCKYVSKNVDTSDLEVYTDEKPQYQNVTASMEIEVSGFWSTRKLIRFSCEEDKEMEIKIELYESSDSKFHIASICDNTDREIQITSLRYMSEFEVFLRMLRHNFANIIIDCEDMSEEIEVDAEPEDSWS